MQNEQYAEAGTPEREAQALEKKARGGQLGAQSGCQELRVLQKQTFSRVLVVSLALHHTILQFSL